MRKLTYYAAGLVSTGLVVASGFGVVSAATNHAATTIGTSGIPRSVFKQDRLDAEAQVLNTSTTAVQTAHKDKTTATLISDAGLTKEAYAQKLKAQLTTDLEAAGYTQDQVTIALQHKALMHDHRKEKAHK
jgi:hypothetical protein